MTSHELEVVQGGPNILNDVEPARRIWICNLRMIPAKLSYIGYSGKVGAYILFTALFLRDVGLSVEEIGVISGIASIMMTLVGPLWGLLVDYTGRRKLIFTLLWILMLVSVVVLPVAAYLVNPLNHNCSTNTTTNNTMATAHRKSHYAPFSSKIFFVMLILEILGKVFNCPLGSMVEAAVMNVIATKAPYATYGDQKLYGCLAVGVMAYISGIVIDHWTPFFAQHHMSRYTGAFIVFLPTALFTYVPCLLLLNQMDLKLTGDEKKAEASQRKLVTQTCCNVKNFLFLCTCFVVGFSNNALVGFLYMLMKDHMHASKSLMGLSSLLQSIVLVFIFPFTDRMINILGGPINGMGVSLFSYFIRFLACSHITNPMIGVITQCLHATCFGLFWASAVVYTQKIAPKGIYVTMFTIVNSTYFGLGAVVAHMLGGVVYGKFGGQALFRGLSVICLLWLIILMICFNGSAMMAYFSGKRHSNNANVQADVES